MAERPKYCGFGGFDVSLFHRFFHHAGDGRDNHSRVPRSNRSHRQCFYKHVRVQHYDNRLCPHCARFHLLFGSQEYNVRRKHLTSRDSEHFHLQKNLNELSNFEPWWQPSTCSHTSTPSPDCITHFQQ